MLDGERIKKGLVEMARKLCDICGTRPVGTGSSAGYEDEDFAREHGMCYPCANEGQMDIAHLNGHESISEDECWFCHPELNEAAADYTPRRGHTNTKAHSHNSHAGCHHLRTPKARAMCRKAGGPGSAGSLELFPAPAKS